MDEAQRDELDALHGASTVVIHPGSLHLRIGRASDPFPKTVPHCIAWRSPSNNSSIKPWLSRTETEHSQSQQMLSEAAQLAAEQLKAKRLVDGTVEPPVGWSRIGLMNEANEGENTDVLSQIQWTNVEQKPEYIVGDDALYLNPSCGYSLIWPFRYGDLNNSSDEGYTITAMKQSLKIIWTDAIENLLEIPSKEIPLFKCILLIPDIFQRNNIRHMMNVLLEEIGFSSAFVIQESVCASFGCGLSSACVVDVGDQKTSVTCVEDGMSLEKCRMTLKYGGRDITRSFSWLLERIAFPYFECQLNSNMLDALLLQELKHTYCHMETMNVGIKTIHFQVRPPNTNIIKYSMTSRDEGILATLAVFWPDLFGLKGDNLVISGTCQQHDQTDVWDAHYVSQTRSKQEESARLVAAKKKELANQSQQDIVDLDDSHREYDDELIIDTMDDGRGTPVNSGQSRGGPSGDSSIDKNIPLPLDQAILWSIDQCESDEMKKRMYSNIVIVGGGLMFAGVDALMQYRIWLQMPATHRVHADTLSVVARPKDLDPQAIAWKGGALFSLLETTQELWIQQNEWTSFRSKILRERAPFTW